MDNAEDQPKPKPKQTISAGQVPKMLKPAIDVTDEEYRKAKFQRTALWSLTLAGTIPGLILLFVYGIVLGSSRNHGTSTASVGIFGNSATNRARMNTISATTFRLKIKSRSRLTE